MKLGTNDISSVYLGTNAVQKVYLGTNEVWSSYAYLLDDYSNAAAAYSLRLLRSAYTGSAIKVRRASDNTEQDIGFVNNELDTSTLTSFCSGTDGFVKTWYDQSGNGRHATQTTAASQPQIVSSGSIITQGSKPTISFNNNRLSILTGLNITNNIGKWYTFSVAKIDDNTSTTNRWIYLFSTGTSDAASRILFGKIQTNLILNGGRRLDTDSFAGATSSSTITLNRSLYNGVLDFANSDAYTYLNNSQIASNTSFHLDGNTSATDSRTAQIGASGLGAENWLGNIQELVIYNTDQNSNLSGINTNINDFYSIY